MPRLLDTARPLLAAFLLGALGTVLGTLIGFRLLGSALGPEGPKVGRRHVLCGTTHRYQLW